MTRLAITVDDLLAAQMLARARYGAECLVEFVSHPKKAETKTHWICKMVAPAMVRVSTDPGDPALNIGEQHASAMAPMPEEAAGRAAVYLTEARQHVILAALASVG